MKTLQQAWPMPNAPKPIVLIGAGGIAQDAHLPAYHEAGFEVRGVFDVDAGRAREVAQRWSIQMVFASLDEARCLRQRTSCSISLRLRRCMRRSSNARPKARPCCCKNRSDSISRRRHDCARYANHAD